MMFLSIIGSINEIMKKHFTFYEVRCFFCLTLVWINSKVNSNSINY